MLGPTLTNMTKLAVTSSHLMTALLLSTYFPMVCYFSHCSLFTVSLLSVSWRGHLSIDAEVFPH